MIISEMQAMKTVFLLQKRVSRVRKAIVLTGVTGFFI
jgi:nitrogen regulatory protein PII-like uncharacterized protein